MDSIASYIIALLFAFLLHSVVIALVTINWEEETITVSDIDPYYIDAAVVARNPYKEKKQQEASERVKKIKNRRLEEADINHQLSRLEEEQTAIEETKPEPVPEIKREPLPVVNKEALDTEAVRSEFENALSLAMIDEQNARKAVTDDEKAMAYVAQIQREIIQNWSRPPSARNGMQTILSVHLVPTGEVVDVKVDESSGNDAFDRSAVLAVRKSGRFVVPADALRFERDFREFTVLFRPDDLRL